MTLFLLTFFLLYGGVHLYAFLKAKQAIAFGTLPAVALAIFMIAMVIAPVLVRLARKKRVGKHGQDRGICSLYLDGISVPVLFNFHCH